MRGCGSAQPTASMGLSDSVTGLLVNLHYSSGEHDHFVVLRNPLARVRRRDQPFAGIALIENSPKFVHRPQLAFFKFDAVEYNNESNPLTRKLKKDKSLTIEEIHHFQWSSRHSTPDSSPFTIIISLLSLARGFASNPRRDDSDTICS